MHTPSLGIHRVHVDATGSAYVTEARLMRLFEESAGSFDALQESLALELGRAWDAELDIFRSRIADHRVTRLYGVG
jgi:hypothetical protein